MPIELPGMCLVHSDGRGGQRMLLVGHALCSVLREKEGKVLWTRAPGPGCGSSLFLPKSPASEALLYILGHTHASSLSQTLRALLLGREI